jgi:hypothetical protein
MFGPGHDCLIFDDQGHRDEQRASAPQSSQKEPSRGTGTTANGSDHHVGVENETHVTNMCYRRRYCNTPVATAR